MAFKVVSGLRAGRRGRWIHPIALRFAGALDGLLLPFAADHSMITGYQQLQTNCRSDTPQELTLRMWLGSLEAIVLQRPATTAL